MTEQKTKQEPIEYLHEELRYYRESLRKKEKMKKSEKVTEPIASWSKTDRLRSGIGKEFCIILKQFYGQDQILADALCVQVL